MAGAAAPPHRQRRSATAVRSPTRPFHAPPPRCPPPPSPSPLPSPPLSLQFHSSLLSLSRNLPNPPAHPRCVTPIGLVTNPESLKFSILQGNLTVENLVLRRSEKTRITNNCSVNVSLSNLTPSSKFRNCLHVLHI